MKLSFQAIQKYAYEENWDGENLPTLHYYPNLTAYDGLTEGMGHD